jgi:hypothetical protein
MELNASFEETTCEFDVEFEETLVVSGGYDEGFNDGKQAEYDHFWDVYQSNGNRSNYNRAFAESYWTDAIFKPKYPITCVATKSYHSVNATSTFQASNITHIDVPITIDGSAIGGIVASGFFNSADELETVALFKLIDVTGFSNTFISCSKLKSITIDGSIDVNFNISATAVLTAESVQSIIDHLKNLTGATAQKLTFHNTVGSKLTEAQKAAITAKNWTLVY